MRTMKSLRVAVAIAALPALARAQLKYTLTDLTPGSPFDATSPNGINAAGHITGYGVTSTGDIHAFIDVAGSFQDLGLLGYQAGDGIAINDSDALAADGIGPGSTALYYANGKAQKVGNIDGNYSSAYGINNLGDVVGTAKTDDGGTVGFYWIGGVFNDMSSLGAIYARQINEAEAIVGSSGYYWTYGGYIHSSYHGYVYSGGVFTDLGSLTGDPKTNTEAYAINNNGQIVGYSYGSDGLYHAFLWSGGTMQDLGTLNGASAYPVAINDAGLVAGNLMNAYGANLGAFVDWNGTMTDLQSLIVSGGSGWTDLVVTGMNASGSIVGYGTIHQATQGFVLTLPAASWKNYGAGFAGTHGVPGFTAEENPVVGTTLTLDLGNSLGADTTAFTILGYQQTSIPTGKGGTLLVVPSIVLPMPLPAAGTTLAGSIPNDPTLSGFEIDLQVIELDVGAAQGLSFTAGLALDLGV